MSEDVEPPASSAQKVIELLSFLYGIGGAAFTLPVCIDVMLVAPSWWSARSDPLGPGAWTFLGFVESISIGAVLVGYGFWKLKRWAPYTASAYSLALLLSLGGAYITAALTSGQWPFQGLTPGSIGCTMPVLAGLIGVTIFVWTPSARRLLAR